MLAQLATWQATLITWIKARTSLDERGASLVEYALLLALIAIVAIIALTFLGHAVSNTLNNVADYVNKP
jgi:pilus assembly protein Flp/PilA